MTITGHYILKQIHNKRVVALSPLIMCYSPGQPLMNVLLTNECHQTVYQMPDENIISNKHLYRS